MPTSSRPALKTADPRRSEVGSPGISGQLTLELEPGLTERFSSVREVVAQGVYQRGLKRVAAELDLSPGNLSVALSGDGVRHLSVDALERYIVATGDVTPILYLAARYMDDDKTASTAAVLEQAQHALRALQQLVGQAAR